VLAFALACHVIGVIAEQLLAGFRAESHASRIHPKTALIMVSDGQGVEAMASRSEVSSNGGVGKRLLNAREAAEFLGLAVDTVYKKARLRELPSVKVGRALRFDLRALEGFLEEHAIQTID